MVRRTRIAWIAVAGLFGLVVLLLVMGLIVQSSALAAYIERRAIPALSEKIGRRIDVGKTQAKLLWRPHVARSQVAVAGDPGEAPLVSAGRITATVELWPFVRSFGREVRVSEVELDDATFNVIRRPDGTFSYDQVVRNLEGPAGGQAKSAGTVQVEVEEVRLRRDKVTFLNESRSDKSRPGESGRTKASAAPLVVDQIDATAQMPSKGGTPNVNLKASFASNRQNVALHLWREPNQHLRGSIAANDMALEELRKALPSGDAAGISGGNAKLNGDLDLALPAKREEPLLSSVHVNTTLGVDRLSAKGLQLTDLAAKGELSAGVFTLQSGTAKFSGGTIDAAGSSIDLKGTIPGWHALVRASQIDLGSVLQAMSSGDRSGATTFSGQCEGNVDLRGRGTAWSRVEPTLRGAGQFALSSVAVSPPFVAEVVNPAVGLISNVGIGGGPGRGGGPSDIPDAQHWTHDGKITGKFTVSGGSAKFVGPLQARFPLGTASLDGRVGLSSGTLALAGPVSLDPGFVSSLSGGKLKPPKPLVVPVVISGSVAHPNAKPSLSGGDITKLLLNSGISPLPSSLPKGIIPQLPQLHLP